MEYASPPYTVPAAVITYWHLTCSILCTCKNKRVFAHFLSFTKRANSAIFPDVGLDKVQKVSGGRNWCSQFPCGTSYTILEIPYLAVVILS